MINYNEKENLSHTNLFSRVALDMLAAIVTLI